MQVFGRDYSQTKSYSAGTHRARSPEETLRDYERYMPELGITRLANITGLDCVGIPVYLCVRPNARSLSVSQGKGVDNCAAKASALMESLENWHAERIRLPLRFESYAALKREGAVMDIERLPLRRGGKLALDRPMMWLEGWDILQNRAVWVPHEFVSMNTVRPLQSGMTFYVSTNGL
ncbi:MAG TPA: YcaO-like family protein, partial [Polyangiaceae bacterium]|nr:YcaO-like family protein [Polyangiaceae bacterium]